LEITYAPHLWCLEQKSLKLYIGSFYDTGAFWESLTNRIAMELEAFLQPHWITVSMRMNVRGGIGMTCVVTLEEHK